VTVGNWYDRSETRAAPYAAAIGGVDLLFAKYLSLGVVARAFAFPYGASQFFTGAPRGPSPGAYLGAALGLHFPAGEPSNVSPPAP
jgi:hypothetical protein